MGQLIRRLSASVREIQDEELAARSFDPVEERVDFVRAERRRRAIRRKRTLAVAPGLAAAAGVALFVGLNARSPEPLTFTAPETVGMSGTWLTTTGERPLPVHFSDGSRMTLWGESRAKVHRLSARGAHVLLERGLVELSVVPRKGNDWVIGVGPFDVSVRGTRFQTGWDPDRELFSLTLHEGVVVVTGACISGARTLSAGDVVEVSCRSGRSTPLSAVSAGLLATRGAPSTESLSHSAPASRASQPPSLASGSAATSDAGLPETSAVDAGKPVDFRALIGQRRYGDAMRLLETSGEFDSQCQVAPLTDLWLIAEAARLGGSGARASQAYRAVRSRFPGTEAAASAAFQLGRFAMDGGSAALARSLLGAYLAERPGGAFAQEAMGRIVELDAASGGAQARRSAEAYLASYPSGPHAALARRVLGVP